MNSNTFKLLILIAACLAPNRAVMMRNSALIDKMVSHFQGKDSSSIELKHSRNAAEKHKPKNVIMLMQNVLCKNFPAIPCRMIMHDDTLKKLIQKSIQQIKYKTFALEKTTQLPGTHLTLFPVINSEDLSNFLQVSKTDHFRKKDKRKQKKNAGEDNHEERRKRKKAAKIIPVYNGRKKIRKFYPHKIKDKPTKSIREFADYSGDKLSMSVEQPEGNVVRKTFQAQAPPVWRIDYTKHGDPSIMFAHDTDSLKGKIMKTGPNVVVDENVLEQVPRKDVLHPDVYIKKNVRKSTVDLNSDGIMD